jgi:hypothetical protein
MVPAIQLKAIEGEIVRTVDGRRKAVREELRAPLAVAATWCDPDDVNVASNGWQIRGVRRADPLLNLHQRSPDEVTKRHIRCAERFRDDYEISEGAHTGVNLARVQGSRGDRSGPTERQMIALSVVRAVAAACGPTLMRTICAVVLGGATVADIAAWRGLSGQVAKGYVIGALDKLADFYEPPVTGGAGQARGAILA